MEQTSSVASVSKVSPEIYDKTTISLHWATPVLVTIQFLIGRTTNFLPRGPLRVDIWSVHVMVGFTLTLVVAAGLLWRVAGGRRLSRSDRGFRRVLPAGLTPNVLHHSFCRHFIRPGFLLHLRSLRLR